MKILDTVTYSDFGKEWYFQLFSFYPNFALIDLCVQWDEFPATEIFPYLIFSIGARHLFGFSFRWKWFQLKVSFIDTDPTNLQWYRSGGYGQ